MIGHICWVFQCCWWCSWWCWCCLVNFATSHDISGVGAVGQINAAVNTVWQINAVDAVADVVDCVDAASWADSEADRVEHGKVAWKI